MKAGLYVHVPFCLTRCGYCDFNAYSGMGHLADRYVHALGAEADLVASEWGDHTFASVFLGGGTPTTLETEQLVNLLDQLRHAFAIAHDAEITTEANPDTIDERTLAELLDAGFTRLSMGAQSFDEAVLLALERVHSPDGVRRAFAAARAAGCDNVNIDLIYGAHGESLESWQGTIVEAIGLGPEHLSCYALTIEPATPLGRKVAAGVVPAPDPDVQAEMFSLACRMLREAGYGHYEVSNWARPGFESIHNLGYWERRPYLGLGAGAHSFKGGRRWWNVRPPAAYLEAVEHGHVPVGGDERLGPDEERMEEVSLALRTTNGLAAGKVDQQRARPYLEEGLLERRNGHLVLTERGMLLATEVALALV